MHKDSHKERLKVTSEPYSSGLNAAVGGLTANQLVPDGRHAKNARHLAVLPEIL